MISRMKKLRAAIAALALLPALIGYAATGTVPPKHTSTLGTAVTAVPAGLKPGEYRLVETQFGWHVIKLVETKPATSKTFTEVKDQIKQILAQQQQSDDFTKYVDELKKKAKIEILDPSLKKIMDAASQPATSTAK